MSQLKQDEWPADHEPTTTEAQVPTARPAEQQERGRGNARPRSVRERESRTEGDGPGELSNVTPDQQVD